jgi:hypothetical protein
MRAVFRTLAAILIASVAASAAGQSTGHDAPPTPVAHAITGQVLIDDGTDTPLRRAKVTLAAGAAVVSVTTVTADDGRFVFADVESGNYTLKISRPGFVDTWYGSRSPGRGPGVPIAVVAGRDLRPFVIRVPRGAAIAGVVRAEGGTPVAHAMVQAVPAPGGAAITVGPGIDGFLPGQTDGQGRYRLHGLPAGDYYVGVRFLQSSPSDAMVRRISDAEWQWADAVTRAGAAGRAVFTPPPDPAPAETWAPAWFPDALYARDAVTITLAAGETRTDVDIRLPLLPTATISGVVHAPDGTPKARAQVILEPRAAADTPDPFGPHNRLHSTSTGPDGVFHLRGITPGDFAVSVRAVDGDADPRQAAMAMMPLFGGSNVKILWAREDVIVQGRDVHGLFLNLRPGITLSGSFVFDGTSPPPGPMATMMLIAPAGTGGTMAELGAAMRSAVMVAPGPDGQFSSSGLTPGRYRLLSFGALQAASPVPMNMTGGWSLRSALLDGLDVSDVPFEVAPGRDAAELTITFSDRASQISGTVIDEADRPTGAFPIVIFSTDRSHWAPFSRRVTVVRPSTDGRYTARGLPPGEYFVSAVTELDEGAQFDPSFLEQLAPASFRILLGEGEQKVQDLRLKR